MEASGLGSSHPIVLPQATASPWPLKTLSFGATFPVITQAAKASSNTTASELAALQETAPDLKFGFEPLTLSWLTMTTGSYLIQRGLSFVLDDIQVKASQLELGASKSFARAKQRLEIANSCGIRDKTEYLRKAEEQFSEAANDFQMAYLQSDCYKYAAICAKLGGREASTIQQYAKLALQKYHAGELELLQLYADSRDPLKNISAATHALLTEALWLPLRLIGKLSGNGQLVELSTKLALGRQNTALRQKTALLLEQYNRSDLPEVCKQLMTI